VAWNEPGGSGDKDPWGRKKSGAGGPDLDRFVADMRRRFSNIFGGGGDGQAFGVGLIVAVALGLWLLSGIYVVREGERGVVLRFGAAHGQVTDKGLNWHFPYPIERVEKVDVENVRLLPIGYRINERTGAKTKEPRESLMLTGDENIVDVEFNVQYRISNPSAFLFNLRDPETTVRQATESAVREVVGRSRLDFVLTEGRQEIDKSAQELLQRILDRYNSGIAILGVHMLPAQPPGEVRAAFDDVNRAREDEERQKNQAEAYANDVIPRARGAAARVLQEAEGYKAASIARAEGDARRFSQVVREYSKAPTVTRDRLYIETMEQVFANTTTILIDQKNGNNLLYLPVDKLIPATRAGASSETEPALPKEEADARARSVDPRSRRTAP
jgi:modulator of FtsH protease HflK